MAQAVLGSSDRLDQLTLGWLQKYNLKKEINNLSSILKIW